MARSVREFSRPRGRMTGIRAGIRLMETEAFDCEACPHVSPVAGPVATGAPVPAHPVASFPPGLEVLRAS